MKNDFLTNLVVVKRSGQRVDFNPLKIVIAIKNAFDSVEGNYTSKDVNIVYSDTLKFIIDNYSDRKTINVEDIQDIIEQKLQKDNYPDVYESFSLYRFRRSESRKNYQEKRQHKFARAIEKINNLNPANIKVKDVLDEYGEIINREYTKAYVLDNKYVRSCKEGNMYIHNMNYFNCGYLGDTFLDIKSTLDNEDFIDVINMIVNCSKEVKGEISLPAFDKTLMDNVKNKYQKTFYKMLNKYLGNMGFSYLVNNKRIEEKIQKEDSLNINYNNYKDIFNNQMLNLILNYAHKDTKEYVKEYFEFNIKKLITILNNNDFKYSISIGEDDNDFDTMVKDIVINIILESDYLNNVALIYKVSNDINEAIKLMSSNKNVKLSFNSNGGAEYFNNGSRIYENIYSDSLSNGRSNISNTSINLARIGIKNKKLEADFYKELDSMLDLVKNELIIVFEDIGDKTKDNYDYLFNKNIYDTDKLDYGQKIRKVIKNGTLNINLTGLYECASTIDKDNYLDVAIKIVKYINKKAILMSLDNKLNFTISHIVNDSSKEFMDIDASIFVDMLKKDSYINIGNITSLKDISEINKLNKLLNGGFILELTIDKKAYYKEIKNAIEVLSKEYIGLVSIRRKT